MCAHMCSRVGRRRRFPTFSGGAHPSVCPLRAAETAVGKPRVARPRRACVSELCVLGMGDLRRALGLHGRAVAGGTRGDIRFLESRIVTICLNRKNSLCCSKNFSRSAYPFAASATSKMSWETEASSR